MSLSQVQSTLNSYLHKKTVFMILSPYSSILLFPYLIYLIFINLGLLSPITSIIGHIKGLMYFLYIGSLILCFAKNKMGLISSAFFIKAFVELLYILRLPSEIVYGASYLIIYSIMGWLCFKASINTNLSTKEKDGGVL